MKKVLVCSKETSRKLINIGQFKVKTMKLKWEEQQKLLTTDFSKLTFMIWKMNPTLTQVERIDCTNRKNQDSEKSKSKIKPQQSHLLSLNQWLI